jgi:hypothetical protein
MRRDVRLGGRFLGVSTRADGRLRANFWTNPATGRPRWLRQVVESVWGAPLSGEALRAQGVYFAADKRLYRALKHLAETADPGLRAMILRRMAENLQVQSQVHLTAFGPDPIPWENGRDLADSIADSAFLCVVLADTETALATGDSMPEYLGDEWPDATGPILARLCAVGDPAERATLVMDLCDAVTDHIGGQAAETLAAGIAPAYRRLAERMAAAGG